MKKDAFLEKTWQKQFSRWFPNAVKSKLLPSNDGFHTHMLYFCVEIEGSDVYYWAGLQGESEDWERDIKRSVENVENRYLNQKTNGPRQVSSHQYIQTKVATIFAKDNNEDLNMAALEETRKEVLNHCRAPKEFQNKLAELDLASMYERFEDEQRELADA